VIRCSGKRFLSQPSFISKTSAGGSRCFFNA
jgi:hypothetical protein